MELKPGSQLTSTVCETEIIVVKSPATDLDIRCGGAAMVERGAGTADEAGIVADANAEGSLLGKRYVSDDDELEVLCTKPGAGSLSIGATPLGLKEAKPLPASD